MHDNYITMSSMLNVPSQVENKLLKQEIPAVLMFSSLSVYFAGPLFAPQSSTNDDIRKSQSNV